MKPTIHYAPVAEAMGKLKVKGFEQEFHIKEEQLVSPIGKFKLEDFEIMETYRYEGNTDPGDESTVYAIQSKTGNIKGVLITGGGASNSIPFDVLAKLDDNNKLHEREQ